MKQFYSQHHHVSVKRSLAYVVVISLLLGMLGFSQAVRADSFEDQIRALQQENRANRSAVADLMETATSYENAIEQLEAQISQVQGQINQNEAQKTALEQEIAEQQVELDQQRVVLGKNIKSMYVSDEMTTIEMLATSKDLSEFVDKETYRNAVQRQVQDTMDKIAKLQIELNNKKQQIEILIQSLQAQRAVIDASRLEQANLLAMNEQQQADFNNKTRTNQAKIAELNELIAAQRNANSVIPDGGMYFIRFPGAVKDFNPDSYPHKNAGFSMQLGPCSFYDGWPDSPDGWGYCTRQCVSYTAWAVGASGRSIPMYYGNAKDWVSRAPASYVHRSPQVGDVAITTSGTWGHAMYVEAVDGNRILVSQYNQQLDGRFSTQWRNWR